MFMQRPQGGGAAPESALQIAGERTSGDDVRMQNVTAVTAVANIVKTSLGPVGLDKVRDMRVGGSPVAGFPVISRLRSGPVCQAVGCFPPRPTTRVLCRGKHTLVLTARPI